MVSWVTKQISKQQLSVERMLYFLLYKQPILRTLFLTLLFTVEIEKIILYWSVLQSLLLSALFKEKAKVRK